MTDVRTRRVARELATVRAMMALYCRAKHDAKGSLCGSCQALLAYAEARVRRCPQLPDKPACARCVRHCYAPSMREPMREVMRFAGPRMIWRHPILTLLHVVDGRRRS